MKFTVKAHAKPGGFPVQALAGLVMFDGRSLLPHEAVMLANALENCADKAEGIAADEAAKGAVEEAGQVPLELVS